MVVADVVAVVVVVVVAAAAIVVVVVNFVDQQSAELCASTLTGVQLAPWRSPKTCIVLGRGYIGRPSIRRELFCHPRYGQPDILQNSIIFMINLEGYIAENIFRPTDDGPTTNEKTSDEKNLDEKNSDEKNSDEKKKLGARHGRCGGKARVINGDSWGAKPPRPPGGQGTGHHFKKFALQGQIF